MDFNPLNYTKVSSEITLVGIYVDSTVLTSSKICEKEVEFIKHSAPYTSKILVRFRMNEVSGTIMTNEQVT